MNERGTSLIELTVVMAIIGTLCAVSVPNWSVLLSAGHRRAVVTEIAGQLRYARQLAIVRHESIRVVFDLGKSSVHVEGADAGRTMLSRYEFAETGSVIQSLSNGSHVLFHPTGRSATATTVTVRDQQGRIQKVTVNFVGKVTLS